MSWKSSKDHMLRLEAQGKANASHKAWLAKWRAAGSPSTQAGMSKKAPTKTAPATSRAAAKPKPITGKNVVGADGLTNQERYQKRLADKAAKAAAEKARIDALDADRPEEVSRYLWEKIKNGDSNFNKTLVTRNPETRDAIVNAGYGEAVKDIHEQAMEEAAAHYVGNGAAASDAFNTAQSDWYNQNVGAYTPEAAAAKAVAKAEAEAKPPMPPAETKGQNSANTGGGVGGIGAFFNGIRNGSATNIKGNPPAGGTDASVTVNQQPAGNPLGMFNSLVGVVNDVRNPNTPEPVKFTQEEIDAELAKREYEKQNAEAIAQAELFNPTQEAGPVRNRNFQTVDYGTQGGVTPSVNTGIGVAGQAQATPWADAYIRAQQSSAKQGPISGLFSKEMENS